MSEKVGGGAPGVATGTRLSGRFRLLDLFAGVGGLSRGFYDADSRYRTVRAVEMDLEAAAGYRANFGDVVYAGDIHGWFTAEEVPEADVVIGGPPCQGFSPLGSRDPQDPRNDLWRQYLLAVRAARPRYFVMENVPAFAKSASAESLRAETEPGGMLADYAIEIRILDAADFGTAQIRKRAVVIGHHRDLAVPGFPAPTHTGNHVPLRQVLKGVRRYVEEVELRERTTEVFGRVMPGVFRTRELHVDRIYTSVMKARIRSVPRGGSRLDIANEKLLPRCWRDHKRGAGDVMGRLVWDRPAITIRTGFTKPEKGRFLHPDEDRAITLMEAAFIQGFPRDHRFVGSKTAIARQIGNAVPVPLAAALGRHLADALDGESTTL
jgi:DNA (cytosine-5)-methyltransferase 1